MNKVVARHDTLAYQIEFPSPVYTSAIMGSREDICVGVGGGKRFGMPNIVVAFETLKNDPKLVWNVCSWLDLGDDIPWSGAKVPMSFASTSTVVSSSSSSQAASASSSSSSPPAASETPALDVDKQYLAMSHLDSISIIEYEKNDNFDPKKLEEEQKQPPTAKLGKRDSPPPPINGPCFLRRVARLGLVTDAENPDKKVSCIVRSLDASPRKLTDQLFFVCQDDGSIVMFRLQLKKKEATGKDKRKEKVEVKKEHDDDNANTSTEYKYDVHTYTIPPSELRMGSAHPTDMDARETASGIVLMIVCDDKKVRVALLPRVSHCLKSCRSPTESAANEEKEALEKKSSNARVKAEGDNDKKSGGGQNLKPLTVMVRSLLSLTPEDLTIPFSVMRSTLRVGVLIDEINNNKTQSPSGPNNSKDNKSDEKEENITMMVFAYDSKNTTTNAVTSRITIIDGVMLVFKYPPLVHPSCKGAVTNIMPLYGREEIAEICGNSGSSKGLNAVSFYHNHNAPRPFPTRWLVTTVEGTIVELVRDKTKPATTTAALVGSSQQQSKRSSGLSASKTKAPMRSYTLEGDMDPATLYPTYAAGHQRPHKPKRNPPHLAAVHQEPISSAAVSARSGLVVTVDIAQKARLSRVNLPTLALYDDEEEDKVNANADSAVGDKKGKNNNNNNKLKNKKSKSPFLLDGKDGIPLLFPLQKSEARGGAGSGGLFVSVIANLFAPLMVLAILLIGILIAVAPQHIPIEMRPIINSFGLNYFGSELI